ncbi:heme-binding protein [Halomarina oriensis]|uniref:Heme-binding protein n=1 Tax=Halomarina oriensis TaxID=671145 RepID=A0A6B0GJV4_9EURY|nr:heme-binding protein [Halomarina oriensis]MWG33679.1 heme-binding protein [Halomarina oriensis]
MPEPPRTDEGWYVLHDFRRVNWAAWRAAPEEKRRRALEEGVEYLTTHEDHDGEGWTAVFSVLGHKADFMVLHLRPTTRELDTLERRFQQTTLADYATQSSSYVSVTEASGYSESAREYFSEGETADTGLQRYIESRIYPDLPDAEHVCFYPMDKRRDAEYNWYDLSFDERADLMAGHGDIGRGYAGKVKQIISGSLGMDDYEWGVTLFADDPTDIKELLYEMRFDPSSSRYADFGEFYFGRRFPASDLSALLAGDPIPTDGERVDASSGERGLYGDLDALGVDLDVPADAHAVLVHSESDAETVEEAVDSLRGNFEHYDSHLLTNVLATDEETIVVSAWTTASAADTASGFLADLPGVTDTETGPLGGGGDGAGASDHDDTAQTTEDEIRGELADLDIYAGKPHGEDVYAIVLYSEADGETLAGAVDDLSEGFDRYDTHVRTAVYEGRATDRHAVVSIWETASAADTAAGFLGDLPGIVARAGEESGFGTMGMFYTVKPDHREEFVETFDGVGGLLADMEGHRETDLMVNLADENDMFIASQWRAREDAMAFFGSDAFRETVQWGRDVLADRPRHVFLA